MSRKQDCTFCSAHTLLKTKQGNARTKKVLFTILVSESEKGDALAKRYVVTGSALQHNLCWSNIINLVHCRGVGW